MSAVATYFKNIYDSAATLFDGMSVTFSYLLQKPITVQYPEKLKDPLEKTLPDRYRGFLDVDWQNCTVCDNCAKACPIDCIYVEGVKIPGRRGKVPIAFYIDLSKCMYCGLCVEPCATDAVFFTTEFEGATDKPGSLIRSYVPDEVAKKFIEESKVKKETPAEDAAQ